MNNSKDTYFECHVTIDPVFDGDLLVFHQICSEYGFRVADLFLQKRLEDTPERSKFDSFCTARDTNFEMLSKRMNKLMVALKHSLFRVRRYKIESTIVDVRLDD